MGKFSYYSKYLLSLQFTLYNKLLIQNIGADGIFYINIIGLSETCVIVLS